MAIEIVDQSTPIIIPEKVVIGAQDLVGLTDTDMTDVQPFSGSTLRVLADDNQNGTYSPRDWTVVAGATQLNDLSDVTKGSPQPTTQSTLRVLADQNQDGTYTEFDWSPPSAGGGEVNDGVSLGTGADVYIDKPLTTLRFRSLLTSSEIQTNQLNDEITFSLINNAIAFNKLNTVATNTFLGRITGGTGNVESLNKTQALTILNVEDGATQNSSDAQLRARSTHTGTQLANTISDFDSAVSSNADVAANTSKVSADGSVTTHSDVTSAGSGIIITAQERLDIGTNNLKVTNATHTGDATGDASLTLQPEAITSKPTGNSAAGDFVLVSDTSNSGALIKVDANEFLSGGGGATELNDLTDVESAPLGASTLGTLRVLADITNPSNGTPTGIFKVIDWSPPTAGGGEVNDGTNIGTGAQIYEGKSGSTLRFRTLVNTAEILIAQNANDLTFSIGTGSVGFDKLQSIAQNEILGKITPGSGIIERLTATDVRAIINVEDGAQVNTVDSVNSQTGAVVLNTDDINDTATNRYTNDTDISRLANTSGTNTGDEVQATETQIGIAEIATNAEVLAGTDDQRIVTPLKLSAPVDSRDYVRNNNAWKLYEIPNPAGTIGFYGKATAGKSYNSGECCQVIAASLRPPGTEYSQWADAEFDDIDPAAAYDLPSSQNAGGNSSSYTTRGFTGTGLEGFASELNVTDLTPDVGIAIDWDVTTLTMYGNISDVRRQNVRYEIWSDNAGEPGSVVPGGSTSDFDWTAIDPNETVNPIPYIGAGLVLQNSTKYWIVALQQNSEVPASDTTIMQHGDWSLELAGESNRGEYIIVPLGEVVGKETFNNGTSWFDNDRVARIALSANRIQSVTMPSSVYGVAIEAIDDVTDGGVVTQGIFIGDTSGTSVGETWANNDFLYVDVSTKQLTNVPPTDPRDEILMGQIFEANAVNGSAIITAASTGNRGVWMSRTVYDPRQKFADCFNLNNIDAGTLTDSRVSIDNTDFVNIVGDRLDECLLSIDGQLDSGGSGFPDPMTTRGDIIYRDNTNTTTRLGLGTNGQVLSSNGTDLTWNTPSGGGDVFKVGTPANNQIGVWTGDGTIEGTNQLTWDGTILNLNTGGAVNLNLNGTTVLADAGLISLFSVQVLDVTTTTTIENAIDNLPNLTTASSLSVTASQVSDFDTEVSNNASVVANSAKVSADGSVTTHNDVTNAGSGQIITTQERTDITTNNAKVSADGSVTTHNDITDAGSGVIISATERSNIAANNAKVSADGSVTTHNDVTDAGSGQIITATERTDLTALKTEMFSVIGISADGTYRLEHRAKYAYTVEEIDIIADGGTCTAQIAINGTPVTGMSSLSVTTTSLNASATAANTVNVGDELQLVISAASSLDNVSLSLRTVRV